MITHCGEIPIISPNRCSIGFRKENGNVAVSNRRTIAGEAKNVGKKWSDMKCEAHY